MSKQNRTIGNIVRATFESNGYTRYRSFSDKRKDGTRRLKYMRVDRRADVNVLNKCISDIRAELHNKAIDVVSVEIQMSEYEWPYISIVVQD